MEWTFLCRMGEGEVGDELGDGCALFDFVLGQHGVAAAAIQRGV